MSFSFLSYRIWCRISIFYRVLYLSLTFLDNIIIVDDNICFLSWSELDLQSGNNWKDFILLLTANVDELVVYFIPSPRYFHVIVIDLTWMSSQLEEKKQSFLETKTSTFDSTRCLAWSQRGSGGILIKASHMCDGNPHRSKQRRRGRCGWERSFKKIPPVHPLILHSIKSRWCSHPKLHWVWREEKKRERFKIQ